MRDFKTGNAEVKKVITITRYVGPGPVASGHFRLVYKGHYTDIIPYNATANQIALALELMPPFLDNLTDVSVSAVPITISYGGQLAFDDPFELIYIDNLDLLSGASVKVGF